MFQKVKGMLVSRRAVAVGSGSAVLGTASLALADTTDPVTTIFTAFNVSSLQSNIQTLLLAGVGISMVFVAYRFFKKAERHLS